VLGEVYDIFQRFKSPTHRVHATAFQYVQPEKTIKNNKNSFPLFYLYDISTINKHKAVQLHAREALGSRWERRYSSSFSTSILGEDEQPASRPGPSLPLKKKSW
jgi:chloramphenicol O-acetyltransferase